MPLKRKAEIRKTNRVNTFNAHTRLEKKTHEVNKSALEFLYYIICKSFHNKTFVNIVC